MSDGEISGLTDLFGDPWSPPKDARGRKRHKRLPQVAERVAVLRACDHTVEQVAAIVGLSEPTLRKYYFRELTEGPELAQAVLNQKIWAKAMQGNVAAARYMQGQFEKSAAKTVARPVLEKPAPAKGKKEQRKEDAAGVKGLFATPAPPKLVISNP